MMGIYAITNLYDGKATAYVGSSVDIEKRWISHKSLLGRGVHDNEHLQRAWLKYGEAAFEWCVVEEVINAGGLLEREQAWLARYFEMPGSIYNINRQASGGPISEETRDKISRALMGHKVTEETKRKISRANSEALRGRTLSEEHRRKMSEVMRGQQHALGYRHTEEDKHKIGKASARPYPAFIHRETGEMIPAGQNLTKLCKERGLSGSHMNEVGNAKRKSHKGWELARGR